MKHHPRSPVVLLAAVLSLSLVLGGALRPALAEDISERVGKLETKVQEMEKQPGLSVGGFRFIPYGYVKVDAAYDDSKVNNGDFIAWVLQETNSPTNLVTQSEPGNDAFSLTGNQSRLDLKVIAPKHNDIETYGLFEIDFYGDLINKLGLSATGGPENRPGVLVRHAFIEMKKGTWGLLVGQTFDPISLQVPDTWNYFVCWMAGNPGYRRPQVRIMKDLPITEKSKVSVWAGVMRTIEDTGWIQGGEESGWPTTWARITYTQPLLGKELLISINGHYGQEEARNSAVSGTTVSTFSQGTLRREVSSYSGNLELIVPLPYGFWLKGEGFYGKTLGTYFAGIGQSFNTTTLEGIRAWGGWGQLGWIASPSLRFHVGASVDNPKNDDLAVGGRSLNRFYYANFMYNVTPAVLTGYEITQAMTQYKQQPNGTDLRHQVSVMYKF